MGFSFGNFDAICTTAALIPCSLLGEYGIEPVCYARNVEINSTILFQPGGCMPCRVLCCGSVSQSGHTDWRSSVLRPERVGEEEREGETGRGDRAAGLDRTGDARQEHPGALRWAHTPLPPSLAGPGWAGRVGDHRTWIHPSQNGASSSSGAQGHTWQDRPGCAGWLHAHRG